MLKRGSEESYRRPVTLWGEGDMIYFVRGGEKPHKHSGTEDGVTVLPARFFAPTVSVGAPRCVGVEKSILGFFSGGEGGKGMVHADACFTLHHRRRGGGGEGGGGGGREENGLDVDIHLDSERYNRQSDAMKRRRDQLAEGFGWFLASQYTTL
jgi:hypothetical protein